MATDMEARQLALTYINRAAKADTMAKTLLERARRANMDFAQKQTDAAQGRRAVLAKEAYYHRMNAELGRTMAAYALLAEKEGTRALSAREAMARVQDAKQREVLVETVKGGELRRNVMLQAAAAAAKALDAAPGLPASVVGKQTQGAGASQMTVGQTDIFRPKRMATIQSSFFPADIRAAASSLQGLPSSGLGWMDELTKAIEDDAKQVATKAQELASGVAAQEPGSAGLSQEAQGLVTQLRYRVRAEQSWSRPPSLPWLHIIGGGLTALVVARFFR